MNRCVRVGGMELEMWSIPPTPLLLHTRIVKGLEILYRRRAQSTVRHRLALMPPAELPAPLEDLKCENELVWTKGDTCHALIS